MNMEMAGSPLTLAASLTRGFFWARLLSVGGRSRARAEALGGAGALLLLFTKVFARSLIKTPTLKYSPKIPLSLPSPSPLKKEPGEDACIPAAAQRRERAWLEA